MNIYIHANKGTLYNYAKDNLEETCEESGD